MAIQVSGCTVIDNSRNLVNVTIGEEAFIKTLNAGTGVSGGNLICKASSVGWIVSPCASEVTRCWYCINDANTTAQSVSGCTVWFVPTCGQLKNPGYTCRFYWDCYSPTFYWSSTEIDATTAERVCFVTGCGAWYDKSSTRCVRSFRCVTY